MCLPEQISGSHCKLTAKFFGTSSLHIFMDNYFLVVLVPVAVALLVLAILILKRKSKKISSSSLKEECSSFRDEEVTGETGGVEVSESQAVAVDFEDESLEESIPEAEVSDDGGYVEHIDHFEPALAVVDKNEELVAASDIHFWDRKSYERWLLDLKEQRLAGMAAAVDNNDESKQYQQQIELVAITEALSFSEQAYAESISRRKKALEFLEEIKTGLAVAEYDMARKVVICEGDTGPAEHILADMLSQEGSAGLAAYHGGRLAEQRMDFQKAMDSYEKALVVDRNNPDFIRSAGMLSLRLYSYQKAQNYLSSLVSILEKNNLDSVELSLARREYAYSLAMVGKNKEAGVLYKKVMHSLTRFLGRDDPEMGLCWYQIARLQETLGRYEQAEEPYRQALDIMENSEWTHLVCEITDKLARLYMELEREREAVPMLERLCKLKEEAVYPDKATLAMAYNHLAEAYRVCGEYEEAEKSYNRSLSISEEFHGKDHPAVGSILQELAKLSKRQGKIKEEEKYRNRAAMIFQHILEKQESDGQHPEKLTL